MMCRGHIVEAQVGIDGDYIDNYGVAIIDDQPVVEGDVVSGTVISIQLPNDTSIHLDMDGSRAFIEACQEILDRYDK